MIKCNLEEIMEEKGKVYVVTVDGSFEIDFSDENYSYGIKNNFLIVVGKDNECEIYSIKDIYTDSFVARKEFEKYED